MKICIVGWGTDVDCDMKRSCKDAGIEVEWLIVGPQNPYSCDYMGNDYDLATTEKIDHVLAMNDIDCFIYKYPFWLGQYPQLQAIIHTRPVVAWQTEHGPTLSYGIANSRDFRFVAITNRQEIPAYQAAYPDKKIMYLPFGSVKWRDDELKWEGKYKSLFVADGSAHYTCGCEGAWKRKSCEVMIQPVVSMGYAEKDLAVYGYLPNLDASHGWESSPWKSSHRGTYNCTEYPKVYTSAEIYLGITFNWSLGGYGVKLNRALSTGIPVIWHRTLGLEKEGFVEGEHYLTSSSAEETEDHINLLLNNFVFADKMGRCGRKFVDENMQYSMLLTNLVNEVNR